MAISNFSQRLIRKGLRAGIDALSRSVDQDQAGRLVSDLLLGTDSSSERSRGGSSPKSPDSPGLAPRQKKDKESRRRKDGGFTIARRAGKQPIKQGFPHRPSGGYPGDFTGTVRPVYSPDLDGRPDPGEVVWAWVPYEEDPKQGKDRPVLLVGRDGSWLLGLMLSSKDHIPGNVGEVRDDNGRTWINVGSGDWDSKGRPSEIRLDRVIRIAPDAVRREGSIMPMRMYSTVVENIDSDR